MTSEPILDVRELEVAFSTDQGVVQAVDGVSFELRAGEILAVVGESGCGKSVTAMSLLGLTRSLARFAGSAFYKGTELIGASDAQLQAIRGAQIAMIFQDPMSSLNPVMRIGDQIVEQIQAHEKLPRAAARERTIELLERVGIARAQARVDHYPHEFSGGMRQRVMIAMALSCDPSILIADEPTTALDVTIQAQILERFRELRTDTNASLILVTHDLDVSIQAQIINLLDDLQDDLGLAYLFVAHDLSVVRHVSDRIAVMYLGKLMEISPAEEIYAKPIHPYTSALLEAIPIPDPRENRGRRRTVVAGEPPNPIEPPPGCVFHPRCPRASDVCRTVEPPLVSYAGGHLAACHHPLNVSDAEIAKAQRSDASPLSAGDVMPATATSANATKARAAGG